MKPKEFPFEKTIIDPILLTIKKHQQFLTKPENLPQLAKLGYMYNTLWYNGRMMYEESCWDNPKYKIEICDPEDGEIEDLIYDAWGMHVSNEDMHPSWEEFSSIVLKGKDTSEFTKLERKPNKTMEDWVEILTNPSYKYSSLYPNRKSVVENLLCVIGTGYDYKNGYIIQTAGGARQDIDMYGDWENAKFSGEILEMVQKVMSYKEVEEVVRKGHEVMEKHKEEKLEKEKQQWGGMTFDEYLKSDKYKEMVELFKKNSPDKYDKFFPSKEAYHPYYPISNYSNISKFDEHTHPSYIKAGIEVCEDILAHREEENKERKGNVEFAEKFLERFKK